MRRTTALALSALTLVVVAGRVDAAPPGCGTPRVDGPARDTEARRDVARKAPVLRVADANGVRNPVVVNYTHQAGVNLLRQVGVNDEIRFHTVQAATAARGKQLVVRIEFAERTVDIDLSAYTSKGKAAGYSDSNNNEAADAAFRAAGFPARGGPGFEQVELGVDARCSAFTIETRNTAAPVETPVRMKAWLAPLP